jgi:NAD(P)-dependent dehydrogenase (short-subunit alcohol dehydrogenase family)
VERWTELDIPNQTGKRAVVTGANSGIGFRTAVALARAGARVVLTARDSVKGGDALRRLLAEVPEADAELGALDLADLSSVRRFAGEIVDRPLDVLINNAGVMAVPESRTKDGFEMQFGTNHLGHFALTNLLLDRVTGRVVSVASGAHRLGAIQFDDINWERPGSYHRWRAYGQSKLANLLFTAELQRRLEAAGSAVIATAAHPGWSATHLQQRTGSSLQNGIMRIGNRIFAQSDEMGALPTLYAATADVPGNSYAGPAGFQEMRGTPRLVDRSDRAKDAAVARRLWDLSEELTGVRFPLPAPSAA